MDACNKVSHGVEVCVNTTPVQSMEKQLVTIEGNEEPPEALGSVTLSQEGDGSSTGLQTRSSARVSKKMRLDSIGTPVAEKREPASETEKPETKPPPEVVKPKRRPWELWSIEDKNTFFEALNEFGKDFDAIQNHFATKARRKGVPEDMIKNKDQIRHFYYRTWHKISKHLKFNDDTKKATQELYALINYGELRKKLGCVSEKTCLKLNELIYSGSTQIRIRGKTLRIKTPICRALRKLNQLEDLQEELKLPSRVFVEMRPRYMEAWCRVQAASQNPCLRTLLPLQRRLTSLLAFLQQRWRPNHVKHRDKLLNSVNAGDLDHELEDYKKEKEPLLRVAPRPNVEIELPTLNLTEYLTSSSLCLSAHEERIARGETAGPTRGGAKGCASKKGGKRQRNESAGEKKVPSDVVVKPKEAVSSEGEVANCAKASEVTNCNSACDNTDKTVDMLVSSTVCVGGSDGDDLVPAEFNIHQIFSLQDEPANGLENVATATVSSSLAEPLEPAKAEVEPPAAPPSLPLPPRLEDPEEILARIRRGWTIEEAHAITVGELYLMFGANSKVQLEYWWEEEVKPKSPLPEGDEELSVSPVSTVLQKLVSIAKLNYRKAKLVCPCGHVCGAPNKSTVSSRNKVPPKVKLGATGTEKNGPDATSADPGSTQTFIGPKKRLLVSKTASPVLQDGVFRRPLLAPSQYKTSPKVGATEAFKAQLDKFRPRYCNRRGRWRPKGVVVQRMLPLLPKAPNGHAMVTLKVIPQTSQLSGEFMPIGTSPGSVINLAPARPTPCSKPQEVLPAPQPSGLLLNDPSPAPLHGTWHQPQSEPMNIDNPTPQPIAPSPAAPESSSPPPCPVETVVSAPHTSPPPMSPAPSISHLLGLELNSTAGDDISLGGVSNGLLDVSLPATNTPTTNFVGLLASDGVIQHQNTPPSSPSRILKENDNQWLNSEVADFSLSSFLNHLESPLKPTAVVASAPSGDDTRLSSDVEAQLQCLMSENSVDYMAKFADLAAQIAADGANKK